MEELSKNKSEYKKKSEGIGKAITEKIVEQLITVILSVSIILWISPYEENKVDVEKNLTTISNLIKTLSHRDESTYLLCTTYPKELNPQTNSSFLMQLQQVNDRRNETFLELINLGTQLKEDQNISDISYKSIREFARWNDYLYKLGLNVCKSNLKSPDEIEEWRNSLIRTLKKYQ